MNQHSIENTMSTDEWVRYVTLSAQGDIYHQFCGNSVCIRDSMNSAVSICGMYEAVLFVV